MSKKKTLRDELIVVAAVVALVITVMANLLADRKFVRADLTSERRYSLSPSFISIMNRLQDKVTLTYYISTQVPSGFAPIKRDILDKLKDIEVASNGKIKLEPIDPTGMKDLRERLKKDGFEQHVTQWSQDERSDVLIFTGIEITYLDKPKAQIPGIGDPEQLEYIVGSKLIELTLDKKPIIAVQAPPAPQQQNPFGQKPQGNGYEWITYGEFDTGKKFDIKPIDISENNNIPPETSLLMIIRPKALNDRQRYEVAKYLAGGGKVFLICNPIKVSHEFQWRAEKTATGLEDYLKEAGITLGDQFIADHSNLTLSFLDLFTGQRTNNRYPFFVKVRSENIDQESSLTRFMPGLVMPFPVELKIDKDAVKKNGLTLQVLAATSKQSWDVPFSESFDPDKLGEYDENKQVYTGSKNVFVMLDGQFPFPYEGKPVPEWGKSGPPDEKDKDKDKDKDKKAEVAKVDKKPGRLIVCSAPDAFSLTFLGDQTLAREMQSNIELLMNIDETCALGDDLIKIRSKHYETRAINNPGIVGPDNAGKRDLIKMALIFGMPLAVIIFALLHWFWRRRKQNSYERSFAQTIGPSSFTS